MTEKALPRVFVLEKTRLRDLEDELAPPNDGDIVIYLRELQDLYGTHSKTLRRRGVRTIWGPSLLGRAGFQEIDQFVEEYQDNWFIVGGKDISADEGLSLGTFVGGRIAMAQKPLLIVMLGEICRLAFQDVVGPVVVVSDISNGDTQFNDFFEHPDINPRKKLLQKFAQDRGWAYQSIEPTKPLPNINRTSRTAGRWEPYIDILRRFIGGLRPSFLFARLSSRLKNTNEKRVYFYLNHGIKHVASALARRPNTRVFCDQAGIHGTKALRYDHHFPAIDTGLDKAVRRTRQRLSQLEGQSDLFNLNGVDYGPFLVSGLRAYLEGEFDLDIFRMKQGRQLIKVVNFDMVVVCGDIAHMFAAMALAHCEPYKSVYIPHGINIFRTGLRASHMNHQETIYIVPGTDHVDDYGAKLPDDKKPKRPVLGSPALLEVEHILGGPKKSGPPRLLFGNFPAKYANTCRSIYDADIYMRDILAVSIKLIARGYRISFRPHPGDDFAYIRDMLHEFGISNLVQIDDIPSFADSLKNHDVFIANTTTCIYQALYAGWPTIFYDPNPDPDFLIGLPLAPDIPCAMARTPEELEASILAAEDENSDVAKFPELFRTKYAPRFIGAGGADSLVQITNYLSSLLDEKSHHDLPVEKTTPSTV